MKQIYTIHSAEDAVYATLRDAIVRLDLEPGRKLGLIELARQFGVSPTPIRQALRLLQGDGLVVTVPRRGARVAGLTTEELEEIQCLRLGIETRLARLGAERCTDEALGEMERLLTEVERAQARGDFEGDMTAQWALRDLCYRCAGKPRLLAIVQDQRRRAERYLRFIWADRDVFGESRAYQVQLVRACRIGDGEAAEACTRGALLWTLDRVSEMLTARAGEEVMTGQGQPARRQG